MPVKAAFMQLSSCWGCHQSLLNAHLDLQPVLSELDIVYWPFFFDYKLSSLKERKDGEIALGFVEGHIRTEQDKENAQLMRKKCKILIALGTCANYGSVAGLGNLFDKEELLKGKYQDVPSINKDSGSDVGPDEFENITPITDKVYTLPQLVDIDIKIPGCPPRTENIVSLIIYLLGAAAPGPKNRNQNEVVCQKCPLNTEGCLLDKGELCFGSITAAGCTLMCPKEGDPCVGCYKETVKVGKRSKQLLDMLSLNEDFDKITVIDIQKFLMLYLGASDLEFAYIKSDPIQRLAKEPDTFKEKIVNNIKTLEFSHTKSEIINNILGLLLYKLKDNPDFKYSQKTVCSTCDRQIIDKVFTEIKRDYEGLPSTDKCLLEEGYICMGPATQAGCGTICPNKGNAPCIGCYGPPGNVQDQGIRFLTTYSSLAQLDANTIKEKLIDPVGIFYKFTLASSILGQKVKENK